MTRIGCRAHDYGKLPAAALAATLRAKGYNAAQLAMPRAIAGIEDFSHITDQQLAEIRTAFAAQDVEISVLSCYQDLSAPDADIRRTAVDTVKRTLGCAKVLGAKMVGSETAWGACTDEEKAARRPLMLDSIARITEEAARLNVVFAVESVDVHPLCTPELLRTVLDTAADTQHCKVVFDPVNLFCAKDGQDKAYQTAHWSRWLEVIGSQLGAVHVKDCRIEADGSKTLLPLGAGDMDYSAIRAFLAHRCCAMRLFCPPTPPMCGICAG
jgi:L-ribulose-5-phosphate 3-epimerase